jgi:thiamine kinase-like enzyme
MDSLARFHAHWWEHPRLQIDIGALAEDIPAFLLREAQAHFADFVDFMADRLSAERRALYEKIMAQAPRRPAHALTLAHGDAHFWNLLAPRNPAEGRVLMIDWAVWHLNTGPSDVAYMLAQHWYPERRARFERPLLQRYHAQLLAHGITNYAWEHCWTDYRLSVVSLVLWPIFWWAHQLSPHIWWHNLERGWLAFTDLGCADFLN